MGDLKGHFKINYQNALPREDTIIKGHKFRITILTERLIRLEYSETGAFEDRPTELVLFRHFDKPQFEKKEDEKYLTIKTSYLTLTYEKEYPFIGSKARPDQYLRVDLNNTDKYWYMGHPEARNFNGANYSLDGASGDAKFQKGLYSTDGFVSIDDALNLIFNEDGSLGKREDARIDTYLFMYRRDFGACLKDYYTLTGYPPLIPRYMLGVIWNRNINYTNRDIENLVYSFNKYHIPLSVILLSDKWHRDNKKLKGGFSFDEENFKKPKRMADYLHDHNIRLSVTVNPLKGISNTEDYFLPFKKASGITSEDKIVPFNIFNKNVLNAYFDYLIHPLMNNGVDFFTLNDDDKENLYSLRALTHYHFDDFKQITNRRGIVLARNGLVASHRYPVTYTGKTIVSWDNLELLPIVNQTAANIGLSWLSNDIGGYTDGIEDGELYARFVQFGCFSPILRLSCDEGDYYKREPWRWDITTSSVVSEYLRLRHSLIPYLYSEAYRYHKTGMTLTQPLYYSYPDIYDEPEYKCEYYFGSSLLVAPITTKKDNLMDRTVSKLYLPEGVWYDFKTGKKYNGGKRYTAFYKLEDYPVFARSGTIIPLAILDENDINNTTNPRKMELEIFPGSSSTYELYEDDGVSSLYERGYNLITNIDYSYQKNNFTVIIRPISGKSGIVPAHRSYRVRFRNTKEPDKIEIRIGDEEVKGAETYTDDNDFIIELPALSTLKQITINCKGSDIEIEGMRLLKEDINSILNDLPIKTKQKELIGSILLNDEPIKSKRIAIRKLKNKGVNSKYINLFLKLLEYLDEV